MLTRTNCRNAISITFGAIMGCSIERFINTGEISFISLTIIALVGFILNIKSINAKDD